MLMDQLTNDLHTSLKAGDKLRTETLRYLLAAIKRYAIDTYPPSKGGELTDKDAVKIVQKQVKTHRESIAAFTSGNRQDLVDKEKAELAILETYLPEELSDPEIVAIVKLVIGNESPGFGQVMGAVMGQVAGKASGERVQKIVKDELKHKFE